MYQRLLLLSCLYLMGFSEPSSAYVSSDGHNYNLTCNRDGYILKSDGPVSRFVEAGSGSRIHNLKREVLFLGKDCDAFHEVYGGGKWCWANGGFLAKFPLKKFGFPRAELQCTKPRLFELRCNC